jgi:hypothetical protein
MQGFTIQTANPVVYGNTTHTRPAGNYFYLHTLPSSLLLVCYL